ncbi:complex I NDUFA9 subunit family protein [Candidatus Pelagibacter sp.]|nr:complex I NDUFA9 subunit family protein [Candidatus Pelagibacter sp.]
MKKVLIFGGSGQIGRHLIRRLTKKNHLVTVVTRNLHKKGIILKTQGNPGYVEVVEANIFKEDELNNLFENKDVCINLVGVLFEKKNNTFKNIHTHFPTILSQKCEKYKLNKLIHVSALGIEKSLDSKYAISKLEGEKNIKKNFSNYTILRPSVVFSVDDNFTTNLMTLLNLLPVFPLYYNGKTKFCPIHVSDFCEIISKIIEENISDKIIECVGPEEISFKEIIKKLLISINKKKILIPIPIQIANIIAYFFEKFPRPLITRDQLKLLKYDNVLSGGNKSNLDIGIDAKLKFNDEVLKYSYMWREGGEYSK